MGVTPLAAERRRNERREREGERISVNTLLIKVTKSQIGQIVGPEILIVQGQCGQKFSMTKDDWKTFKKCVNKLFKREEKIRLSKITAENAPEKFETSENVEVPPASNYRFMDSEQLL